MTDFQEDFGENIANDDSFELNIDKDEELDDSDESLFGNETDKESDKYEPLSEEESLSELENENIFEPLDEKDSLQDTGLEETHDFERKEREDTSEEESEGDKGEDLKDREEKEEKKKDKDDKEEKVKKGKRGKRGKKGRRGKSGKINTKKLEKEIKDLKKNLTNKGILMKTDEELMREMMNKKYKRQKNIEEVYKQN